MKANKSLIERIAALVPASQQKRVEDQLERWIDVLELGHEINHNPVVKHLALTVIHLVDMEACREELREARAELESFREMAQRQELLLAKLEAEYGLGEADDVSPAMRSPSWGQLFSSVPLLIACTVLIFSLFWVGHGLMNPVVGNAPPTNNPSNNSSKK